MLCTVDNVCLPVKYLSKIKLIIYHKFTGMTVTTAFRSSAALTIQSHLLLLQNGHFLLQFLDASMLVLSLMGLSHKLILLPKPELLETTTLFNTLRNLLLQHLNACFKWSQFFSLRKQWNAMTRNLTTYQSRRDRDNDRNWLSDFFLHEWIISSCMHMVLLCVLTSERHRRNK